MKRVKSKKVCRYCNKIIDKKPIPVGDLSFAHEGCVRQASVRVQYLSGEVR